MTLRFGREIGIGLLVTLVWAVLVAIVGGSLWFHQAEEAHEITMRQAPIVDHHEQVVEKIEQQNDLMWDRQEKQGIELGIQCAMMTPEQIEHLERFNPVVYRYCETLRR